MDQYSCSAVSGGNGLIGMASALIPRGGAGKEGLCGIVGTKRGRAVYTEICGRS